MSAPNASTVVMIVEDSADLRYLYKQALRLEGFVVIEASHGLEALDQLVAPNCLPHVILLDLMMPIMDGWTFLRERESNLLARQIPVIVNSAAGHRVPANVDFLAKPVDLNTLIDMITLRASQFVQGGSDG